MALLFVIPSVLIFTRGTEIGGPITRLVGYAFYACPLTGYLLITLASGRKERAEPMRWVFAVLYVVWLITAAVIFVMGKMGLLIGNGW